MDVRISSESSPVFHVEVLPTALRALHRGGAMGLTAGHDQLTENDFKTFIDELWTEQIGRKDVATLQHIFTNRANVDPAVMRDAFQGIYEALAESPVPRLEWRAVRQYLDDAQLARLMRISETSVQRYARGTRETPDNVIAKLHWLALVIGHLNGSYNEFGVRRWFQRSRQALDGYSPEEILLAQEDWNPDAEPARKVETLARSSLGMNVT